ETPRTKPGSLRVNSAVWKIAFRPPATRAGEDTRIASVSIGGSGCLGELGEWSEGSLSGRLLSNPDLVCCTRVPPTRLVYDKWGDDPSRLRMTWRGEVAAGRNPLRLFLHIVG